MRVFGMFVMGMIRTGVAGVRITGTFKVKVNMAVVDAFMFMIVIMKVVLVCARKSVMCL
jgi:hypothetical protein